MRYVTSSDTVFAAMMKPNYCLVFLRQMQPFWNDPSAADALGGGGWMQTAAVGGKADDDGKSDFDEAIMVIVVEMVTLMHRRSYRCCVCSAHSGLQ